MKIKKCIYTCGILTTLLLSMNIGIANAEINVENEFSTLISKYNIENVIVENGISLRLGEELDLLYAGGWETSNDDIVEIDENSIVHPLKSGTTFLSNEINGKVHIIEVYVPDSVNKVDINTKSSNVNRNYYKVLVDAGHGGHDNGAHANGLNEDELNLQIAKNVESKLRNKGIEVMMSRTSDTYVTLSERAAMANNYGSDVFISIHQNSADSKSANGIETYYHTDKTSYKPYSSEIQKRAIAETGARDRGVKSAKFVVLSETNMPSALFESGFISNVEEGGKLSQPWYQEKIATAIADGVEKYLKENITLSGNNEVLPTINTGIVTATSLNVRSGPNTSSNIIGRLYQGDDVEIVEDKNGWYQIRYNNGYGYISSSYVKLDEDAQGVIYQSHIEEDGWQSWKSNGKTSGTNGEAKRIEAIKIKINDILPNAKINYRVHGEDYGWQDWKSNGELAGSIGQSKRIEAIEIKLENAPGYKIEYRVHGENYGWQDWKSNGELAGSIGQCKRIEAIEVRLVEVDSPRINYRTHIEEEGWQNWKNNGEMSGTSGESKRIEGIEIKLSNLPSNAKVTYQAHVQDIGWQEWRNNGEMSGTSGQSKRIEAIKIKLENAPGYNVRYRVHVEDYGWQEWKNDGDVAGTIGECKRIEAIEIKLVK